MGRAERSVLLASAKQVYRQHCMCAATGFGGPHYHHLLLIAEEAMATYRRSIIGQGVDPMAGSPAPGPVLLANLAYICTSTQPGRDSAALRQDLPATSFQLPSEA